MLSSWIEELLWRLPRKKQTGREVNSVKKDLQNGQTENLNEEVQEVMNGEVQKVQSERAQDLQKEEAREVQREEATVAQKLKAGTIKEKANSERRIKRSIAGNFQITFLIWQPPKSPIRGPLDQINMTI